MIEEILKHSKRRSAQYKIGPLNLTLLEMSVEDQFEWEGLKKKHNNDMAKLYAELISRCCVELAGEDLEKIQSLSPQDVISMGSKIIELSNPKKG